MITWKIIPKNLCIAKYIECYWYLEKGQNDMGNDDPKLYPDPSAHLIITDEEQNYHYQQGEISQKGKGTHWIFPHRGMFTMDHRGVFKIIGIKFKTGALYSCLPNFSKCELEQIMKFDVNQLLSDSLTTEILMDSAGKGSSIACPMLDKLFEPWISSVKEDGYSHLVREIIPLMGTIPIAQVGRALHCSQRTTERSFLKVTSLTLKQYQSMIRLENILAHLYPLTEKKINWTDLAYQFEFSDQPHLIRYLKSIIGKTPNEYTRDRDLTIDIYGDFEVL